MAEPDEKPSSGAPSPPRPPGSRAKRAAIAVLFSAILLIPRLRRWRRRPAVWAWVRLAAVAAGGWLIWRFARPHGAPAPAHAPGVLSLFVGIVLAAFGVLVRARPETSTLDAVAGELGALVVLNGGSLETGDGVRRVPRVSLALGAERLTVLDARLQAVEEIPLSALRQLEARAAPAVKVRKGQPPAWQLELAWEAGGSRAARFVFSGFFAEHLARVAGRSIASQWKKALPVVKP